MQIVRKDCNEESSSGNANTQTETSSDENKYSDVFQKLRWNTLLNKASHFSLNKIVPDDPSSATSACLQISVNYCYDIYTIVSGTLMATSEMLLFLPFDDSSLTRDVRKCNPIEMHRNNIVSITSYRDASVFVFTKRPRVSVYNKSSESIDLPDSSNEQCLESYEIFDEAKLSDHCLQKSMDVVGDEPSFLCCSIKSYKPERLSDTSPVQCNGAHWFIIPKSKVTEIYEFLSDGDLGLASVRLPCDDSIFSENCGYTDDRTTRRTWAKLPFIRSLDQFLPGVANDSGFAERSSSPMHYLDSLRNLVRRPSKRNRASRILSAETSDEFFSKYAISNETDEPSLISTTESTPSFAEEKEVFVFLRQNTLEWELLGEDELLLRCNEQTERNKELDGCTISPPACLYESQILNEDQVQEVFNSIPRGSQGFNWFLTYSTERHGFSLKSLYRRCELFCNEEYLNEFDSSQTANIHSVAEQAEESQSFQLKSLSTQTQKCQPCVLLIRDSNKQVMGAYLSSHPRLSAGEFYGTGESFVFHWTLTGGVDSKAEMFYKYQWSGKNSFFISCEQDSLTIGCFNTNCALRIDEDILHGRTQSCETFSSPQLSETGDFVVHTLELWSIL